MDVKQVATLVNQATSEVIGAETILTDDLSNVVDVGEAVFNADAVDRFVKSLVNHIGKVIFVDRKYKGSVPSVLMDSFEYGSVLEKIKMELPEATVNETWNLEDGASYDPNIFTAPKVSAKFFNSKVTFEVAMSFTEKQVKQSFSSANQLNGFVSMLYNGVENSMTVKSDALVMRTINNFTAETLYSECPGGDYTNHTGSKAVNLLKLYKETNPLAGELTPNGAVVNPEFIRFSSYIMSVYVGRLSSISTLFNIGKNSRFTPADKLHFVLHSDFASASKVFLQSDTFHDDLVKLPSAETVAFWQGSGTGYNFADTSKINVKTSGNNTITAAGILGVMFDRDALGVSNYNRRVTANYNGKAEFFNNWFKMDAGYFNDFDENFVVFYVA